MSGPSNAQTDIVWPGYVAAMASLLLSLLLVAAVLVVTISQIGSVSESYQQAIANIGFKNKEEVDRVARLAGISDTVEDQASDAEDQQRLIKEANNTFRKKIDSRLLAESKPEDVSRSPGVEQSRLDLMRTVFNREAAREAADLVSQDKALLAQIDLSGVDISKVKFKGIDIRAIDLSRQISASDLKKIDFSQINLAALDTSRLNTLKPFIAKEAIRYQLQIKPQAPKTAVPLAQPIEPPEAIELPKPKPQIDSSAVHSNKLQINFIEDVIDPLTVEKQQIVQELEALRRQTASIRIWTTVPSEDIYLKRTAYSRLIVLRVLATQAGFASSSVQLDIVSAPSSTITTKRDMAILIAEHKK
jgi:hypothetical protein